MTKTKNYGLEKPDSGDYYDVSVFSRNMDIIDKVLGGLKVCFVTPTEYEATQPHDPNTLYYVVDDGKVSQYLGDAKLGGGGSVFSGADMISEHLGGFAAQRGHFETEETEE